MIYMMREAAAALGVPIAKLQRWSDEVGVPRIKRGAVDARTFTPEILFQIAKKYIRNSKGPRQQKILSVWIPKGGQGKTTIAGNLASQLALQGESVLLIDLDFQGSLSLSFGYETELSELEAIQYGLDASQVVQYTLSDLLPGAKHRRSLKDVIKTPNGPDGVHLIPADTYLDLLEADLMIQTLNGQNSDKALIKWISEAQTELSGYDWIIFDCPPAKNRITRAALLASNALLAPVKFDLFSTKALSYMAHVLADFDEVYQRCPQLIVLGNAYQPNLNRSTMYAGALASNYANSLLEPTVRRSEDFPRSLDAHERLPLILQMPLSASAQDIRNVAHAVHEKMMESENA